MKVIFLFLSLFIGYKPIHTAPLLELDNKTEHIALDRYIDILEDKNASQGIEEIRQEDKIPWEVNTKKSANFGVTKSIYWLRINLFNKQDKPGIYYIKIANPFLDFIDAYFFDGDSLVKTVFTGEQRIFFKRDVYNHHFVFKCKLKPSETRTVFFRIKTTGVMDLPVYIYSLKSFLINTKIEYTSFAIYFGILISLLLYNLFLYISIRESSYLYYVFFLCSIFILSMSMNGLANEFLWPNFPLWGDRATNIFVTSSIIFAGLFIRSYININLHFPEYNKIILYFLILVFLLGFISIFKKYPTMILLYASLLPGYFFALLIGIQAIKKKIPASKYFLIAWIIFMSGASIRMLKALGFFTSSFITEYSVLMGSALEMLLFSFGLADRINQEKKSKQTALLQVNELLESLEEKVKQRTEDLQKAKQEADSANELKDKFLSIVSHDLRSPISGVLNLLEALKKRPNDFSNKQIKNYLNLSYNSLSYSLAMVEKLLDLNKIKGGQLKLNYSLITIDEIFSQLKNEFLPLLKQKDIRLVCDNQIPDEVITVDIELYNQILRNILNNAIKFSPKGGKIKFTTYRDNYKILIIIEDNGTGIPEKILPYLFDKSVKTSKKGTEGELGHGLGLIYAYDSIKLLQGQISASNRPKGGASFCIEIPDNEKTMLIADDSNEYRRNLADAFRRENWLVLEASDGEEVLEILCNIIPDILITDKNMPRMGGIEVINYLQENPDYENIIIFLLSADFSRENLIEIQANNDPTLKRIRAFLPRFENIDWIKKKVMQVYKYEE